MEIMLGAINRWASNLWENQLKVLEGMQVTRHCKEKAIMELEGAPGYAGAGNG